MTEERIVEEPLIVDVVEDDGAEEGQEGEEVADNDLNDAFENTIEVDDIEPLAPLSLRETRVYASRLFEFVTINIDDIKRAGHLHGLPIKPSRHSKPATTTISHSIPPPQAPRSCCSQHTSL
jgi:hypothetical protein